MTLLLSPDSKAPISAPAGALRPAQAPTSPTWLVTWVRLRQSPLQRGRQSKLSQSPGCGDREGGASLAVPATFRVGQGSWLAVLPAHGRGSEVRLRGAPV